jgi:hypothetical protein
VHQDGVHEMATVMHKKPPCDNQGSNGKEIMDKSGSSDEGNHEESFDTEGTEDPYVVYLLNFWFNRNFNYDIWS